MGLLSYINTMEQNGPGLLKRAAQYEAQGTAESFYAWCKEHALTHAAIFQRNETFFYITKAVGFDAESIALSYSTQDFWNGTLLTNGNWQTFLQGQNETASFNQFFSETMLSMIAKLHFLKSEDFILLVLQEDNDLALPAPDKVKDALTKLLYTHRNIQNDIETEDAIKKGLAISNANLYFLSIKTAVTTAVKDVPFATQDAREKTIQTIYNELFGICERLFQKPNCTVLGADGEIKIAFFAKDEVDEKLMQFHIANMMTEIVGTDASKGVILLTAGICPNAKGTLAFLRQG